MASSERTPNDWAGTGTRDPITAVQLSIVPANRASWAATD